VAGVGDEDPMVAAKLEEGEKPKDTVLCCVAAKTLATLQKISNITKWLESSKRKMRLQKAAKRPTMCSIALIVKW